MLHTQQLENMNMVELILVKELVQLTYLLDKGVFQSNIM